MFLGWVDYVFTLKPILRNALSITVELIKCKNDMIPITDLL